MAVEYAQIPITVPKISFIGAIINIGMLNTSLPRSPKSRMMRVFSQRSQGTICVKKVFASSSKNE